MSLPASLSSRLLKKSASSQKVEAEVEASGDWLRHCRCLSRYLNRDSRRSEGRQSLSLNLDLNLPQKLRPRRSAFLNNLRPVECTTECVRQVPGTQLGFTLVEVLVVIALLATIGAIVFGSLVTTTRVVDAGREQAAKEQTVRRILRIMADEVSISKFDQSFPWVGVNGTQEGQPADTLAFLAMSDGLGISTVKGSEMIRVVYTREGDRLIRFTRRNLYGLTDESLDRVELANRVKGFNLRYFDAQGRVWTDEWLTTSKIPKALLLEVTFQPPDADPWIVREWITIGTS